MMSAGGEPNLELSPEDQRVLDRLVEAGFDPKADLPPGDRARAERLRRLLALLNDYPVEDPDESLVHATIARVERLEDERAARMTFDSGGTERRRRLPLPDFISVAAIILIAAGIFWPTLTYFHERSVDERCANNLRMAGYAFSNYRADHDGAMPMALAGLGRGWVDVPNVINLGPLVDGGYCDRGVLCCPGLGDHEHVDAGYSYQWQMPGLRVRWDSGRRGMTLILGDRNPLIDAYRARQYASALSASQSHGGRGQNALATDGSTMWLTTPVIGHQDNIWLPAGVDSLREGFGPADEGDVFLAH